MKKTDQESFVESITVQAKDCEELTLAPVSLLQSQHDEILRLRARLAEYESTHEARILENAE